MNVSDDQLTRWHALADEVRGQINVLKHQTRPNTPAWEALQGADDAARRLGLSLEKAGAQRPADHVQRLAVPLDLLNTAKSRRYLRALQDAHAAALEMDVERGYGDEGTGAASGMLETLLAEAEEEINGPAGLVRE